MRAVDTLRRLAIAAGIGWAIAFIAAGLAFRLQLYGDGAIFSYAVAVQDVWAFHWHNISQRSAVYLLTLAPAEVFVALTGSATGGIAVYGVLFFALPLTGLAATYLADRSLGRIVFVYACASTALLCPLVFGFPTEMWLAHAAFWPALALARDASHGRGGAVLVFAATLALAFAHEGGIVLAAVILMVLVLRGWGDGAFRRATFCLLAALIIWVAVKILLPPGDYFADVYVRAATHFFGIGVISSRLVLVLAGALAAYGGLVLVLSRVAPERAYIAAALVAMALAIYWWQFDHAVHADHRYHMRTALVLLTPVFGVLAGVAAMRAEGRPLPRVPLLAEVMATLSSRAAMRAVAGAFVLVMLVHVVETVKFVAAWTRYESAVRALATGTASDPSLGDAHFVSSARIAPDLNRLSWFSTTPYLGAVLAGFAPARLVIDPAGNYFWLSCATATANSAARRDVPVATRDLVRIYSCLHR